MSASWFYYSSQSGKTARLMESLGYEATRIPLHSSDEMPTATKPYILVCASYGDGQGRGSIPKRVREFLQNHSNRSMLRGVVGLGDRNFGRFFAYASVQIADSLDVDLLHRMDTLTMRSDIERLKEIDNHIQILRGSYV